MLSRSLSKKAKSWRGATGYKTLIFSSILDSAASFPNGISDTELDTQVAAAIEKSQKVLDSPVRAFPIAPCNPLFYGSKLVVGYPAAYSSC